MNASAHSTNLFRNSCDHISTNGKAPLHYHTNHNTQQFLYSLWRMANARNVSFLNLSRWTRLIKPHFCLTFQTVTMSHVWLKSTIWVRDQDCFFQLFYLFSCDFICFDRFGRFACFDGFVFVVSFRSFRWFRFVVSGVSTSWSKLA